MGNILEEDIQLIQRAIDQQYQSNLKLLDRLKDHKTSAEDRLLLIDIVNDDFARNGLDGNDEPNSYGMKLEAIIDRLSP